MAEVLLSFDEYQKLGGSEVTDENEFKKLERDAEAVINPATHFFYLDNDINQDPIKMRVKMFKLALMYQIDFTKDVGASTPYEIANKSIKSVSVDGTSVSTDQTASDLAVDGIYNLAMEYLNYTGLTYVGVPYYDRRWPL